MKINNKKNGIFLLFGILILVYLVLCDFMLTFSIILNLSFIVASLLLFALFYVFENPIVKEEREPSFFHIFVKVASIAYFGFMLFVIIFNICYPKKTLSDDKKYDYIIVFGAGIKSGKGDIIHSRLDKACEYANKYDKCKFVLTGAKGDEEPIEEAYYMRNYMTDRGVDESRILVDPFSMNTFENICNALDLILLDVIKRNKKENIVNRPIAKSNVDYDLDFLNLGFMSSEFHMTRISLMAKKKGIEKPYSIPCITAIIFKPYMYVRENFSLLKALLLDQLEFR